MSMSTSALLASKKKRDTMQRIEDLEAWEDSGMAMALHSSTSMSTLKGLSAEITEQVYDEMLHKIADLGSRFVLHRGNSLAEDFISKELAEAGYEVKLDKFQYSTEGTSLAQLGGQFLQQAEISNVVAFKQGGDLSHETIVI